MDRSADVSIGEESAPRHRRTAPTPSDPAIRDVTAQKSCCGISGLSELHDTCDAPPDMERPEVTVTPGTTGSRHIRDRGNRILLFRGFALQARCRLTSPRMAVRLTDRLISLPRGLVTR